MRCKRLNNLRHEERTWIFNSQAPFYNNISELINVLSSSKKTAHSNVILLHKDSKAKIDNILIKKSDGDTLRWWTRGKETWNFSDLCAIWWQIYACYVQCSTIGLYIQSSFHAACTFQLNERKNEYPGTEPYNQISATLILIWYLCSSISKY